MGNETEYTLADYLQGKVAITISDETIKSIFFDRGAEYGMLASNADEKTRDLCLADLYMFCANMPTSTGTVDDKNGNWEHKEGSVTLSAADKKRYMLLARRLYLKWGEIVPSFSSIKWNTSGMRTAKPRCKML